MYQQKTKNKVMEHIKKIGEITANKLQYLGQNKKQVHNGVLTQILYDLEQDDLIIVQEHIMNGHIYRVIKWKEEMK